MARERIYGGADFYFDLRVWRLGLVLPSPWREIHFSDGSRWVRLCAGVYLCKRPGSVPS